MQPPAGSCATNIGVDGRRLRLFLGIAALVVGMLALVGLVLFGVPPPWRVALLVPFWVGAAGVLQARTGT